MLVSHSAFPCFSAFIQFKSCTKAITAVLDPTCWYKIVIGPYHLKRPIKSRVNPAACAHNLSLLQTRTHANTQTSACIDALLHTLTHSLTYRQSCSCVFINISVSLLCGKEKDCHQCWGDLQRCQRVLWSTITTAWLWRSLIHTKELTLNLSLDYSVWHQSAYECPWGDSIHSLFLVFAPHFRNYVLKHSRQQPGPLWHHATQTAWHRLVTSLFSCLPNVWKL